MSLKKQSVLLVDDLPANLLLLEGILGNMGLNLVRALSGREALERLDEEEYALVLLDVMMPEMDGYEVARRIRANDGARDLPIIFITAMNRDQKQRELGYEAGAADFLFKPVDPEILRSKVRVFCVLQHKEFVIREQLREIERQAEALNAEIAERRRVERAQNESEIRYRALVELAPEAILVQVKNEMVYFNATTLRLLGASNRADLEGRALFDFADPDERETLRAYMERVERQGGLAERIESKLRRLDGETINVEVRAGCTLYDDEVGVLAAVLDITKHKRLEEQLLQLSAEDGLTGVANRCRFDEALLEEWRRALRHQSPLSLVLIDIDHFKAFNDNYGHQRGDRCLKHVAHTLGKTLRRASDLLARYGGEEFVVILPDSHAMGAAIVAEYLRADIVKLGMPHAHSETADCVTISLGVSTMIPVRDDTPETLIAAADKALYQAKAAGRNQVVVAEE